MKGSNVLPICGSGLNVFRLPAILMTGVYRAWPLKCVKMANKPKSLTIPDVMVFLVFKVFSSPVNNSFLG